MIEACSQMFSKALRGLDFCCFTTKIVFIVQKLKFNSKKRVYCCYERAAPFYNFSKQFNEQILLGLQMQRRVWRGTNKMAIFEREKERTEESKLDTIITKRTKNRKVVGLNLNKNRLKV